MSTPTLRRFVISYSAMLTFMVAVSSYSLIQLGRLSAAAHIAVSIEQRMLDQADGLADAFLSEVRYGGKFSVTQAAVHYEQYKEFKADFERRMDQLKALATSADAVQRLSQTEEYHAQYQQLFEREVEYIRKNQPYAESRYRIRLLGSVVERRAASGRLAAHSKRLHPPVPKVPERARRTAGHRTAVPSSQPIV